MVVNITLNELQSGLKASKFTAILNTKDNKYKLEVRFNLFFHYFKVLIKYSLYLDFER